MHFWKLLVAASTCMEYSYFSVICQCPQLLPVRSFALADTHKRIHLPYCLQLNSHSLVFRKSLEALMHNTYTPRKQIVGLAESPGCALWEDHRAFRPEFYQKLLTSQDCCSGVTIAQALVTQLFQS